jgi:hypothetical protein
MGGATTCGGTLSSTGKDLWCSDTGFEHRRPFCTSCLSIRVNCKAGLHKQSNSNPTGKICKSPNRLGPPNRQGNRAHARTSQFRSLTLPSDVIVFRHRCSPLLAKVGLCHRTHQSTSSPSFLICFIRAYCCVSKPTIGPHGLSGSLRGQSQPSGGTQASAAAAAWSSRLRWLKSAGSGHRCVAVCFHASKYAFQSSSLLWTTNRTTAAVKLPPGQRRVTHSHPPPQQQQQLTTSACCGLQRTSALLTS